MVRFVPNGSLPMVGLTLDWEAAGGYAASPWYAVRENYCAAVVAAGGLPILLPHEPDRAEDYLGRLDALIVTGGAFDVDPSLFGAADRHPSVTTKDRRTAFELAITRAALAEDRPLLGICGGAQLLNVALGGSLIQHIPDEVAGALDHEQAGPRDQPGHEVAVTEGSRLAEVCGSTAFAVNSTHHQAVKAPGAGLVVNAVAPDGVIEGIEAPARRFCLGVQWHPEFEINGADRAIFRALVDAGRA